MKASIPLRLPIDFRCRRMGCHSFRTDEIKNLSPRHAQRRHRLLFFGDGQWKAEIFAPARRYLPALAALLRSISIRRVEFDALDGEDETRPIPDGRISPPAVCLWPFFFILTGSWVLLSAGIPARWA